MVDSAPFRARQAARHGGRYALLVALGALFLAPLVWMVTTSFKTNDEAVRIPPTWWPEKLTTYGYETVLGGHEQAQVLRWFGNSLVAATAHMLLVLVVASLAAYPLARMEFRGKRLLFGLIIGTLFIPGFVFLIPNFMIVSSLGWLDSLWALVVPGAAGAFGVFFLRQFFLSLPPEIEEAARLDGANHFQIFWRVVVPLSKPALATLAVLSFLGNWNDFLWPVYVMFNTDNFTLPAGLATLQRSYIADYPVIMAGAVISSIPVLILFVVTQRYVIEGVARSGLKG